MLHKYDLSLNKKLFLGGRMNQVEPIRNTEDIQKMYTILRSRSQRDYLLFKFAIHTGVKLCELLNMKVHRLKSVESGNIKTTWIDNVDPSIQILLPPDLRNELQDYIDHYQIQEDKLIFQSLRTGKGLSRQQAYRIIHKAAEESNIPHVGLTTLRKTFAYHAYQSGISISIIQKYLGHQTTHETMKFIGIKDKTHNNTVIALNL